MYEYGWTWVEGEDEEEGNSWIQISLLENDGFGNKVLSEETAIIMCRNYEKVKVEHPKWIIDKEKDAQLIVDALNHFFQRAK